MNSLEKICLCSVANNASLYEIEDFEALNVYILEQLVSYLGTYQLNRLHNIFVKAGVEVERVWKSHLALHWTSKVDFPATVFNSDDVRGSGTESRRVYLERLFQKVISNLDPGTDEPQYVTKLKRLPRCRHGNCFQCLDSTTLDSNTLQRELPQYAVHVRILSVAATDPMVQYLLKDRNLLRILQQMVCRLDMHYINKRNFSATWELVWLLLREGSVSAFSVIKPHLPSDLLETLLRLVSGQQVERSLGSFLATVDRPVAEVETKCLVEDETCASTELKELGRNSLAEYDDTDIPHAMTVCESKNLTRDDEMSRTSLHASDDSVASDIDGVVDDNDLYNIALTTSGSNANSCRASLCCSNPGDPPRSLYSANDSSRATIQPNRSNTSGLHLSNSQSGCDWPPCAVFNSETSCTVSSGSLSPCSVLPPCSCTSFALGYYTDREIGDGLFRILRNWTTLQKLALFEVSDSILMPHERLEDFPVVRRLEDNDLRHFLYKSVENNQLTHIVSFEVDLDFDVAVVFTSAILTKRTNRPLEELKISLRAELDPARFPALLNSTDGFFGTVCLNFDDSNISYHTTSEFIISWIRGDRALRCLHLPKFFNPTCLTKALHILECNQRIEELHIGRNRFDATCAPSLISMVQSCPLRKLILSNCDLSKIIIDVKLFVEAISMHPTLVELDLQHNYLEDVGCDLLKGICLRKAFFNSLDLSFNHIEGKLLFDTCQEIQTELRKRCRSTFPLSELNLSGNIFHLEWRNRLVQTLVDWVNVVVVQDPNLGNPAGPLADYISQM